MEIAFIAHDNKKELMEAFCIAYKYILDKHTLYATGATGAMLSETVGVKVNKLDYGEMGEQQIAQRVAYNEIDLVILFRDPETGSRGMETDNYLRDLCDTNNIPFASNIATAEVLILGLERGDFAWRDLVNPNRTGI